MAASVQHISHERSIAVVLLAKSRDGRPTSRRIERSYIRPHVTSQNVRECGLARPKFKPGAVSSASTS